MNVLVILLNTGMPYDLPTALNVGVRIPNDALHVVLGPETRLPYSQTSFRSPSGRWASLAPSTASAIF